MEESDTVFEVSDLEPFPRTIADAILRMLGIAQAANPAIDSHEVLLELADMRRARERRSASWKPVALPPTPVQPPQDPFEDLQPTPPEPMLRPTVPVNEDANHVDF
jgi:hypothetical protein